MSRGPGQAVRIGIVGCGSVMQGAYTRQLHRLRAQRLIEVVAACDLQEQRREFAHDQFGPIAFSTDYREVVERPDVDLVLVLTAMPAHGTVTRAALKAGKHVLVEKPMSVDLAEAAELVELSRTSPGLLLPAPHVVLSATYQAMWRSIQRGEIGRPLSARALYGWAGPDWAEWFYKPGGGALFDLGVYNVTTLTGLMGPVKRVTALAGVAIPEREINGQRVGVEAVDNAHVLMDFGGGVYAVVTTGFTIQRYRCPAVEIYGSEGVIQMLGDDWAPTGHELWQNSVGAWKLYDTADPGWPWTDGLRHLVECIQGGARPLITPEHGYHVLEIMLKAQEAGRDGQARAIESTFAPPAFDLPIADGPAPIVHDPRRHD